jgi:two-component system response regulator (stage 0 sporulation protein A)
METMEKTTKEEIDCGSWTLEELGRFFEQMGENKGMRIVLSVQKNETFQDSPQLETAITGCLTRLGIAAHLKGYSYIRTGIRHCIEHPEEMEGITKILYPAIAREHNTTANRVEHGIRHAVSQAWKKRDQKAWAAVFGCCRSESEEKPANAQFIATLADYIRMEGWGNTLTESCM